MERVRVEEKKEIGDIKTEKELCKYIKKERRCKKQISRNIKKEEWKEYFKNFTKRGRELSRGIEQTS